MKRHLLCFTQDLRLSDNHVLQAAITDADQLLAIYIWPEPNITRWGCERLGPWREKFIWHQLHDLRQQLRERGSDLFVFRGKPFDLIRAILDDYPCDALFLERHYASEEQHLEQQLATLKVPLHTVWQSGMYSDRYWQDLPTSKSGKSLIFTDFRRHVEAAKWTLETPIPSPSHLPPPPPTLNSALRCSQQFQLLPDNWPTLAPASSTIQETAAHATARPNFFLDSASALQTITQYFAAGHAHHYKQTRNDLSGQHSSSHWSPWLAQGVFSARQLMSQVREAEQQQGANESTYWLWFELLWRDYFRYVQHQAGATFFYKSGMGTSDTHSSINGAPHTLFSPHQFKLWNQAQTGVDLVDAGMRELNLTGFCSNRMRQILASYWLNELQGDWRAGAAWFEYQLIDYDVYSNYGNWLYMAGLGTDPRGGRHFNIERQISQFDADGTYREYWLREKLTAI